MRAFPTSLRWMGAALALTACDNFTEAYNKCVTSGRCGTDAGPGSDGGPLNPGLRFADPAPIVFSPIEVSRRSKTATRFLVNPTETDVDYTIDFDGHLHLALEGTDGGLPCRLDGIPARTTCRWDVYLESDTADLFNGGFAVQRGGVTILSLFVNGDVVPRTAIALAIRRSDGGYEDLGPDAGVDLGDAGKGVFRVTNAGDSLPSNVTVTSEKPDVFQFRDGTVGGRPCTQLDAGWCFFDLVQNSYDGGLHSATFTVTPVVPAYAGPYLGTPVLLTVQASN